VISDENYRLMANSIRALSMDAVEKAKSGHPGMPMGMADVATILFSEFLKYNPKNPKWFNRDRFILSAGHGSMLLYSLLYLTGYEDITIEDIKNFRQFGSKTAGHPEYGFLSGIETTTGPLGQGLANAVGMALAERILSSKLGNKIDHYTYAICGDGCLMEGISQEAISFAAHLNLNKLIILFDDNGISIDGPTSLSTSENQIERFKACGWNTIAIDGHNYNEIRAAITQAKISNKPSFIACKTTIGFGSPTKQGTEKCHGAPLGSEEIIGARKNLNWPYEPFFIPEEIKTLWENVGSRFKDNTQDFTLEAKLPQNLSEIIKEIKKEFSSIASQATRKSSGLVLEKLADKIDYLIGGSADLTESNNTKTKMQQAITKGDYSGSYIYYGIREHAMVAIMNGLALHGGIIPYAGTFLVFSDYARPAIRLAALMHTRVIFVGTHDSIGLGEDGPTHQPVEHLAALRAIPNLYVYRPCDAIETAEVWELALLNEKAPSVISLTRQNVAGLERKNLENNMSANGAYIISLESAPLQYILIASGSEVQIAIEVQKELEKENIGARVVSMVCTKIFDEQDNEYKEKILVPEVKKIAIEAACSFGWEKYIGQDGIFIGVNDFGVSAPYEQVYDHFGITKEKIIKRIKNDN